MAHLSDWHVFDPSDRKTHTFGTDLFKATKDPFLTRDLMGHTDLSTTDRYQHPELHHEGGLMDARNQTRLESMS
jgi:site-specific recombinase XerC